MFCLWDAQGSLNCNNKVIEEFSGEPAAKKPDEKKNVDNVFLQSVVQPMALPIMKKHNNNIPTPPPRAMAFKSGVMNSFGR